MNHWTTLDTIDDHVRAWHATPASSPRGGLVILQEIFGVLQRTLEFFQAHPG